MSEGTAQENGRTFEIDSVHHFIMGQEEEWADSLSSLKHCPLCTKQNHRKDRFIKHLFRTHSKNGVEIHDLCVVSCTDTCLGKRKQHAHYHCPCGRIITRKDSMVNHALIHEKEVESFGAIFTTTGAATTPNADPTTPETTTYYAAITTGAPTTSGTNTTAPAAAGLITRTATSLGAAAALHSKTIAQEPQEEDDSISDTPFEPPCTSATTAHGTKRKLELVDTPCYEDLVDEIKKTNKLLESLVDIQRKKLELKAKQLEIATVQHHVFLTEKNTKVTRVPFKRSTAQKE